MKIRWGAGLLFVATALAQNYNANSDERLNGYIEEALERNPAVKESFANYRAGLQRLPQAAALPDPMIGLTQFARSPETRVGPQTTVVSIQQRFPWWGKLSDQEQAAAKEAAGLAAVHEAEKAEVVRRVKRAYYELAYVDRAIAVTEAEAELLGHFETLAQARYSQGVGLQQDAVKLQAEITRVKHRLETLGQQRVDAESLLNQLRDRPSETPLEKVSLLPPPPAPIDLERLYSLARRRRPEIEAAFARMESEEKRTHLARRQGLPDFTLGASFGNVMQRQDPAGRMAPPPDNGKDVYSISVGVNLPIFRRKYDAAVLEAAERFVASKHNYRRNILDAERSVRSSAFEIESLARQIALFEKLLLPQAEQSLQSSEAAYASGTAGVLDLLDSERVLYEVRLSLAQFQSDYMKALAELERAIGSAFPEATP